jgi:hypothetical protein
MRSFLSSIALLAGFFLSPSLIAANVRGAWVPHKHVEFDVSSISGTIYSCDGATDKMKTLLKAFGATNVRVQASCSDYSGISEFITLYLDFETFMVNPPGVPAAELTAGDYSKVSLSYSQRDFGQGDCQFVEDFARDILPFFESRLIGSSPSCMPFSFNMWSLQAMVLTPKGNKAVD